MDWVGPGWNISMYAHIRSASARLEPKLPQTCKARAHPFGQSGWAVVGLVGQAHEVWAPLLSGDYLQISKKWRSAFAEKPMGLPLFHFYLFLVDIAVDDLYQWLGLLLLFSSICSASRSKEDGFPTLPISPNLLNLVVSVSSQLLLLHLSHQKQTHRHQNHVSIWVSPSSPKDE